MLMRLHEYQKKMALFALLNKHCILSVDMGLGKTLTMLYILSILRPDRALIIAPKRVAENTWTDESAKWGLGLDVVSINGNARQRKALIQERHKIQVIGREHISEVQGGKYDILIIDELTSFKNIKSKRTQEVVKIEAERKIGLTGTLCANGLIDIYSQAVCCDLSFNDLTFEQWRAANFENVMANAPVRWEKWEARRPMADILAPIKKNIFTLTSGDWLTIPSTTYDVEAVQLSETEYNELSDLDAFLQTETEGGEILAIAEGAKFAKLQTYCNGFIYDSEGVAQYRGESTKLQAVADYIINMAEKGENTLVFYAYKYEVDILTALLKKAKITPNLITEKNIIQRWNNGEIKVLLAHPASAGHGLNLQRGGRIVVWSTLTYNYELFAQGNARLARQGQEKRTIIKIFVAKNTIEEKIYKALSDKTETQDQFKQLTK